MEIVFEGRALTLPGSAERALLAQPCSLLAGPSPRRCSSTGSGQTRTCRSIRRMHCRSGSPTAPQPEANQTPELVTREGVGYRANVDPESVDAIDFANRIRLARAATAAASGQDVGPEVLETNLAAYDGALELWRGEPLSDFNTEHWAISEAARLDALRITALTERAQAALALGRHHEVVHDLEPVVGGDPTLESLAGLLMLALYRGGRQADALGYARTRQDPGRGAGSRTIGHSAIARRNGCCARTNRWGRRLKMAMPVRAPASGQRRTVKPAPRGRGAGDASGTTNLPPWSGR